MYRKCVTEKSVQHQRQVEVCLLELMRRQSYEDISVTAICQSAGISRRIFYHLFNNKNGALYAMLDHAILDIESYRPDIADPTLRFFRYWKERKNLLDALRNNDLMGLLLERMIECVLNEDYDVRHLLKATGSVKGKNIVVFVLSGLMGLTCSWYYGGFQESAEEMAALLVQLTNPQSP